MKHLKKFESFTDVFLGSSRENEKLLEKWNKHLDYILYDEDGYDLLVGCQESERNGSRVITFQYFESEEKKNVKSPFSHQLSPETGLLIVTIPKNFLTRIKFYWQRCIDFDDPNIEVSNKTLEFSSSSDVAREVVKKLDYVLDAYPDKKPNIQIWF